MREWWIVERHGIKMVFVEIYIAVFVILIAVVFRGAKSGRIQKFFRAHPRVLKALILFYVIFAGCFMFPIFGASFPPDFQSLYVLLAGYGMIALAFAGIWGPDRWKLIYLLMLLFTAVGMGCRYLLEFGEVSNTYNFTPANVISYLVIIPPGTTITYQWIVKMLKRR